MSAYVSPSPTSPVDSWLYRELVMEATAATSTTQAPTYSCRGTHNNTAVNYWTRQRRGDSVVKISLVLADCKDLVLPHLFSSPAAELWAAARPYINEQEKHEYGWHVGNMLKNSVLAQQREQLFIIIIRLKKPKKPPQCVSCCLTKSEQIPAEAGHYHADLQPAVGCCEEERGDVVGISELQ